jgi:hypothetical protein
MYLFLAGLILFVLPFVLLSAWGLYQLYLSGGFVLWMILSGLCVLLGSLCWSRVRKRESTSVHQAEGESFWQAEEESIWREIQARAAAIESGEREIKSVNELEELGFELLELVSKHYFPNSKKARFEVNLSHLLLVCEQASRDLRVLAIENIPFHDRFSVNDFFKAKKTLSLSSSVYSVYRGLRVVTNPTSAIFAELRELLSARAGKEIANTTSQWLLARFVESAGKHLINLYSGQAFDSQSLLRSNSQDAENLLKAIPLRIVLTGQHDSGKSTLLDALLPKESRTAVELGNELWAYVAEHPILGLLEVLELPSTEFVGEAKSSKEKRCRKYLNESDVVYLVLAADNAARSLDLDLLDRLREGSQAVESSPEVIPLITRCDLLPPIGWHPPYVWESSDANREARQEAKVKSVLDCQMQIEKELRLLPNESILLGASTCYEFDEIYQRMKALESRFARTKIQRALKAYRKERRWSNVKNSVSNSGRLIAEKTIDTAVQGAKGLLSLADRRKN